MKVSVVIPVYNEVGTIEEIVSRVHEQELEKKIIKEIIIVDDASNDGTRERLEYICQNSRNNIQVFYHDYNQGKGAALRTGFSYITGDIVIIQDADLEVDPKEYPRLLEPILDARADVVYGSRFLNRSSSKSLSLVYLANRFLTGLTNVVSGIRITDMETCYKVFKRKVLKDMNLKSNRFGFEPEFTIKLARKGIGIYEVPINYNARSRSEGKKINWKDGIKAVFTIIWFRVFD